MRSAKRRVNALLSAAASAKLAVPILFAVLLNPGADAQLLHPTDGAAESFEVATVKPNLNVADVFYFRLLRGRFMAENAPLARIIRFAYDVKSDREVLNMPEWASSTRFDIDGKIGDAEVEAIEKLPPDQKFQQYQLMLQSLLADRFQMRVTTETQELPVYALVVAKNGPKLAAAAVQPEQQRQQFPRLNFTAAGDLKAKTVSMAFFAGWLSGRPDTGGRVVIDATGLKGSYDFALKWSPVENGGASGGSNTNQQPVSAPSTDGDAPSLFTAVQEQLGLKLTPQKGPVEVLVIDHVEQPSPN
jgi:uncharacterized protein (TIGR03435 family)